MLLSTKQNYYTCNVRYCGTIERERFTLHTTNAGKRLTSKATEPNDFSVGKGCVFVLYTYRLSSACRQRSMAYGRIRTVDMQAVRIM